jgi:hypothetical protein
MVGYASSPVRTIGAYARRRGNQRCHQELLNLNLAPEPHSLGIVVCLANTRYDNPWGSTMRKVLCLLLVIIFSTVAFSAAGDKEAYRKELEKKVKIVMNPDHVEDCELINLVEAKSRATLFTGYVKNQRAYVKLREKALEMGGNTVLLFETKNNFSRTRLQGEAYLCPTTNKELTKEKPEGE